MYTTILLGAGASQAAGFPSTRDLTEQVLNGSGVTKNSGAIGYEVSSNDARLSTSPEIQPVVEIVHRLYELAKQYFLEFEKVGGIEQISYEDLFYLAKQAHDEFAGEMENPAIFSFANELNTHYASNPRPWCRETLRYITSIVWKRLARHEPDLESVRHLKVISDVSNAGKINCIATLCGVVPNLVEIAMKKAPRYIGYVHHGNNACTLFPKEPYDEESILPAWYRQEDICAVIESRGGRGMLR